ncbi:hypothetical protein PG993_003941 [Apiospora rasikravindrae]|uniref:Uncharacterized protein n=1 Tax=Apiospora rasikravindrae TaxID=990691 RepID=A0ABR1U0Y2_9PEZI
MAESLSLAASGIAVAQLGLVTGGAVLKLKQLWNQVKDAPETISDLIERVDLIYPSVWDFERQCTQSGLPPALWNSSTAAQSILYCRKALKKLSDVVDGLSAQISTKQGFRQRLVAFKVVLKKDELKRLEEQLRNSLEILRFAQDAYTRQVESLSYHSWMLTSYRALVMATPDIVTQKFQQAIQCNCSHTTRPFRVEPSSPDIRKQEDGLKYIRSNSRRVCHIKWRIGNHWIPTSLFGHLSFRTGPNGFAAEFRGPRSTWDVQLRLYSHRPRTDSIFRSVKGGDIADMQSMFDQRKASPFDRDEDGWTLIHHAVACSEVEITRLLFEMGMGLTETDKWGRHPLAWIGFWKSRYGLENGKELTRLLLPEADVAEINPQSSSLMCRCPVTSSWDILQDWQPILCPSHNQTTIASRVDKLAFAFFGEAEIQQSLLNPEWSAEPEMLCNEAMARHGFSLLHQVAENFASFPYIDDHEINGRLAFAKSVMRMTNDLHPIVLSATYAIPCVSPATQVTPLLHLILEQISWVSPSYFTMQRTVNGILREWVELLTGIGMNVEKYGETEYNILRNTNVESYFSFEAGTTLWEETEVPIEGSEILLYGFTYGPSVKDWTRLCNEPTDRFAGEFWDLVEECPLGMPGAWFE